MVPSSIIRLPSTCACLSPTPHHLIHSKPSIARSFSTRHRHSSTPSPILFVRTFNCSKNFALSSASTNASPPSTVTVSVAGLSLDWAPHPSTLYPPSWCKLPINPQFSALAFHLTTTHFSPLCKLSIDGQSSACACVYEKRKQFIRIFCADLAVLSCQRRP